jgi:hypothetical protein
MLPNISPELKAEIEYENKILNLLSLLSQLIPPKTYTHKRTKEFVKGHLEGL